MIRFWRLKRGFRRIFSSTAQKSKLCLKMRFYKPCTSAVSESEFNRVNRILRLKMGMLPYKWSWFSKYQGYLLVAYLFYDRSRLFVVAGKRRHNFLPLATHEIEGCREKTSIMRPKLFAFFNCAYQFAS